MVGQAGAEDDPRAWARSVAAPLGRAGRELTGTLLGLCTAALTLVWALAAAAVLASSPALAPSARNRARGAVSRWAVRLSEADLARLARWAGCAIDPRPETAPRVAYLLLRLPVALACGYLTPLAVLLLAVFFGGAVLELLTGDGTIVPVTMPGAHLYVSSISIGLVLGLAVLAATWLVAALASAADRALARRLVGPSQEDLLHRRIDELTHTRSGIVWAVDEERRRIERDLHDGVQQRVVALAMLLGRAQRGRDPERTERLVRQAHTETRVLLDELRDVAWRVYPTALDTLGLESALTEVAERSPLPVQVRAHLSAPPPEEVATAVYFVAREAITNAAKHAEAHSVIVHLDEEEATLNLRVLDDGRGGADPGGSGLTGLARRVRALDGTLAVHSPPGGPTTVHAALPLTNPRIRSPHAPGDRR
ncbi:signal transduction histidine kinase [Nocardiopsis arvandica]|uniref:histidine kinase n=1 Tax=Nocardiopsis sinuspersici TaxID=501010 RepID=A0A7Z0BLE0_9ACTN|nr:sensor histidine kinase [Nocardiopsis sinuspersici]NYH55156.1 signal transduction histidine kinase [Nocardiopsis sinuspersici]